MRRWDAEAPSPNSRRQRAVQMRRRASKKTLRDVCGEVRERAYGAGDGVGSTRATGRFARYVGDVRKGRFSMETSSGRGG